MVVGEPSLMGGDFGDEDERLITRLENTQYDAANSLDPHSHDTSGGPPPHPHQFHSEPTPGNSWPPDRGPGPPQGGPGSQVIILLIVRADDVMDTVVSLFLHCFHSSLLYLDGYMSPLRLGAESSGRSRPLSGYPHHSVRLPRPSIFHTLSVAQIREVARRESRSRAWRDSRLGKWP